MGRFISILAATFISVVAALATWDYAKSCLAQVEADRLASEAKSKSDKERAVVKEIADSIKYEWKVEERTNPVTGEKVATASRFSEGIDSAVTFRCYGLEEKRFDVLISFAEGVDWSSSNDGYYSHMKFKIGDGELFEMRVARSSSSVAVPALKLVNVEKASLGLSLLKEHYRKQNSAIREFKKIGAASKFAASIPDGTIYQQVIEIDLDGVGEAIKPVLALCGQDGV